MQGDSCAGAGVRGLFWSLLLALLLPLFFASAARALPEVKLGTGVAITPAQADSWYAAQGLASPSWSEVHGDHPS